MTPDDFAADKARRIAQNTIEGAEKLTALLASRPVDAPMLVEALAIAVEGDRTNRQIMHKAPFHTGGVVTSTAPAVLAPLESRWSLSVDHGARDASIVMVEHAPAGPRLHPASRPHEATAFVYIDEPPDPASYMLTLARAANQTGRPIGGLISRVVPLADARRDAVLARERARPSILLALPAEPEGDDR